MFQCNNLPGDSANDFIAKHPLVNDLVENYNPRNEVADLSDPPLFFSNGVRYSAIVVDELSNTDLNDDVIFVGTGGYTLWGWLLF